MKISRAAKLAMRCNGYIRRKSSVFDSVIKPGNTGDCCVIYSPHKSPGKRWHPKADDIIARDWVVIKKAPEGECPITSL